MFILASQSPRRRELLSMAGLDFICIPSDKKEVILPDTPPERIPVELAAQKAEDVFLSNRDKLVVGADTIVVINGRILGKPAGKEEAAKMLRLLSGKTHIVYTGVALRDKNGTEAFCSASYVTFYELTDKDIADYISTGEPMDKAGGYGIQGRGSVLVKHIEGDYFTIMGLPLAETVRRIKRRQQSDGLF